MTEAAAPPNSAQALAELLAARRAPFLAFVRRYARASQADAEDLLQQAFLRASESVDTVRDPAQIEAWFYRILRNTVADSRAAASRQERKLKALFAENVEPDLKATAPEANVCACSLALLDRVRPEYADIVRRVDLGEGSVQDAASALQISPGNAKVRLHRARAALREELASYCGTLSMRACQSCRCEGGADSTPVARCGAPRSV